jgi:hypothetical protein
VSGLPVALQGFVRRELETVPGHVLGAAAPGSIRSTVDVRTQPRTTTGACTGFKSRVPRPLPIFTVLPLRRERSAAKTIS